MTSRFLWALLLLMLLAVLSACAPETETPVPEENAAELSETVTPEEEAAPDLDAPDSEKNFKALAEAFSVEEELAPFMTPDISIKLSNFTYGDFDGDGVHEAFAVKRIEGFGGRISVTHAALFFVRSDGCTVLELLEQTGYPYDLQHGTLDAREFFLLSDVSADYIYTVKDSRAVRLANPAQELAALVSPSERFIYGDFDGDGHNEAFAVLGNYTYFFNEESYELLRTDYFSSLPSPPSLSYPWMLDGKELIYDGANGYSVENSQAVQVFSLPYPLTRAGDSDLQFTMTIEKREAVTTKWDGSGITFDSTAKQYWLYWNGERFAEYGGRKLERKELAAFTGGLEILSSLSESGADIGNIYYRDNGIITVNYHREAETTEQGNHYNNFFRILSYSDAALTDITEEMTKDWPSRDQGAYLSSAFFDSVNTYSSIFSPIYDVQIPSRLPVEAAYDFTAAATESFLKNVSFLSTQGRLSILADGDFDGDGQNEAFALLSFNVQPDGFIRQDNFNEDCIYLFLHSGGYTILGKSLLASFSRYVLDGADLFCFAEYSDTLNLGTHVYTVTGSRAVQIAITGTELTRIGDTDQFYFSSGKNYDTASAPDGSGPGGFTYKLYWLYWDGERLVEYGGLRISEEQLGRFAYGKTVLDAIKNEGNTIDEIYYRGNGVININYGHMYKETSGKYFYSHSYKNLLYRDGSVTDIPKDWGYHPRYYNYDSEEELPSGGPGRYLDSYGNRSYPSMVDVVYPTSFP
ncbi:MAG: hypothetical protein LBK69_02605 [Syntrophomonadaceae bacterium]|jgi:hypothetical protein|nr:hypothetical protein [Syntrophomonadaceae bacterium]